MDALLKTQVEKLANEIADQTLAEVQDAMGMVY